MPGGRVQVHVVHSGQPGVAVRVVQLLSQHLRLQSGLEAHPELVPLQVRLVQALGALRTGPHYQLGLHDPATGRVTFSARLSCTFR